MIVHVNWSVSVIMLTDKIDKPHSKYELKDLQKQMAVEIWEYFIGLWLTLSWSQ